MGADTVMTTIEEKERQLVDVLKTLGPGWHERPAIAAALGKAQLNPVEVATLDLLTSQGQIEQSKIPTRRPHILRSVYRIKVGAIE
jgi:hypothetical protein